MLDQILAVLSLDKVDDPNLPYMGYFTVIDPLDPVVEKICMLADGLRRALSRAGLVIPASCPSHVPTRRAHTAGCSRRRSLTDKVLDRTGGRPFVRGDPT